MEAHRAQSTYFSLAISPNLQTEYYPEEDQATREVSAKAKVAETRATRNRLAAIMKVSAMPPVPIGSHWAGNT